MDCSMQGFPVLHHLWELVHPHVHWVSDTIQPSHPLSSVVHFSSCPQSFPASGSFLLSQLFASGGQSIGASASSSALLMNTQDWFPFGLTGLISLWIYAPRFKISQENVCVKQKSSLMLNKKVIIIIILINACTVSEQLVSRSVWKLSSWKKREKLWWTGI